ncbi:MAG: hypothetical protein NC093_11650 [Alistipes sp.]|nr:hypothetical protein [Alistipes sp.]
MLIPTEIELLNYQLSAVSEKLLTAMLNKTDKDYSMIDELFDIPELSEYTPDDVQNGVRELYHRGFLLEVRKPYGCVYAVNKLRIPNMMFKYN